MPSVEKLTSKRRSVKKTWQSEDIKRYKSKSREVEEYVSRIEVAHNRIEMLEKRALNREREEYEYKMHQLAL